MLECNQHANVENLTEKTVKGFFLFAIPDFRIAAVALVNFRPGRIENCPSSQSSRWPDRSIILRKNWGLDRREEILAGMGLLFSQIMNGQLSVEAILEIRQRSANQPARGKHPVF
jgi:hypothetical protein